MKNRINLLAAMASMALAACVGSIDNMEPDPDPDPDPDPNPTVLTPAQKAREAFDRGVHPVLASKCLGCHSSAGGAVSTAFVSPTVDTAYVTATSYATVVGNFTETGAQVYAKVQGGHYGPYTLDESADLLNWLGLEVQARAGTGGTPEPTPEGPGQVADRLLKEWSACMKQTDFDAANMAEAWSNTGSDEGNCEVCHEAGYADFIATANRTRMFGAIATDRYFMLSYFVPDVLSATPQMVINRAALDRVALAQVPHTEHPRFDINNNGALTALEQFYTQTMANKAGALCDPAPKLTN